MDWFPYDNGLRHERFNLRVLKSTYSKRLVISVETHMINLLMKTSKKSRHQNLNDLGYVLYRFSFQIHDS